MKGGIRTDDLELRDGLGMTPLHHAAERCDMEGLAIVKLLLKNGADPSTKDGDGQTPLSFAILQR